MGLPEPWELQELRGTGELGALGASFLLGATLMYLHNSEHLLGLFIRLIFFSSAPEIVLGKRFTCLPL